MDRIESVILRSLLFDDAYVRRVLPYLEPEYFFDRTEKEIFNHIKSFVDKYNVAPSKESMIIDMKAEGLGGEWVDEANEYLNMIELVKDDKPNVDWITERTEAWCQEKSLHIAVSNAINILDGKDKKIDKGAIPKMLQDALSVSFDPHVGHDYFADASSRYDFYHRVDSRIPFHLDYFNKITKNGVPNKTLNICLAGTNVGKSLYMCDLASSYLMQNRNVLYITLEMAEERIAERIDANLLDIPLDNLTTLTKDAYQKRIERINARTKGRLVIKEYPTASAHVGHFRHLLNELWLKKNFKPHAIFIDYLNICASSRVKANSGLYEMVKGIAEELRGLAVEFNVPIWSATQMNRAGFNNADPDLTNTSESFGLPATADFMFALVNSEELNSMNQFLVKILKNRYGDVNLRNKETGKIMSKFVVGVDKSKQKLYNLDESAQDLSEDAGTKDKPPSLPLVRINNTNNDPPWDGDLAEPKFDVDNPTLKHKNPKSTSPTEVQFNERKSAFGGAGRRPKPTGWNMGDGK